MGGMGGGGRGGPRPGPNLFGSSVPGISELDSAGWKETMDENAEHRNVVVVFYEPKCQECEEIKKEMTEFAEKFNEYVQIAAVNCGKQQKLCDREKVLQHLPTIQYYGLKKKPRFQGDINYKSLSKWFPSVMSDLTTVLETDSVFRDWLVSDDKVPHVVFFTERKSVPPLMKTLSVEFAGRAALGVVYAGVGGSVATALKVEKRPALLHVVDEDSLETVAFEKDFKKEFLSFFLSKANGRHRSAAASAVKQLTPARLEAGDCGPADSNFCLLYVGKHGVTLDASTKDALRHIGQRLKTDPIKVFFVQSTPFSKAFELTSDSSIVLYRPKRKKFKIFDGDVHDLEALAAFVESAVGSGTPLPNTIKETPSFGRNRRGEL